MDRGTDEERRRVKTDFSLAIGEMWYGGGRRGSDPVFAELKKAGEELEADLEKDFHFEWNIVDVDESHIHVTNKTNGHRYHISVIGKQHDTCGRVNFFIGRALCKMHRNEEGMRYIDDAITTWDSILGEENAGSAEALLFKAKIYAEMNTNEEPSKQARICAEKAIEIYEKIGNWNDKANMGYSFLARMYEKKYPKIAELYLRKLHPLIEPIDLADEACG